MQIKQINKKYIHIERFKSINTNFRKNRDHALNKICPEERQPQ